MLVRLALLLIAVPAIALAQDAPAPRTTIPAPPPTAAPAAPPTPTLLASTAAAPLADPAECRAGCAQTNYFCRAGEHPDNCGADWSQCVAACDLPDLNPSAAAGP